MYLLSVFDCFSGCKCVESMFMFMVQYCCDIFVVLVWPKVNSQLFVIVLCTAIYGCI